MFIVRGDLVRAEQAERDLPARVARWPPAPRWSGWASIRGCS
ncbi:MAG: hypothetical protein ACRD0K_21320 [Egibacteraceae bacterium]